MSADSRIGAIFKKSGNVKLPQRRGEDQREQYGRAGIGLVVCKKCHNVLFDKKWHSAESKLLRQAKLYGHGIHFLLCPACNMEEKHLYEGEIIIKNIPSTRQKELPSLISAYGKRALSRDSQDRILSVKQNGSTMRILTTENQLAVKLAKKIKDTLNAASFSVNHSREPFEVSRVTILFSR